MSSFEKAQKPDSKLARLGIAIENEGNDLGMLQALKATVAKQRQDLAQATLDQSNNHELLRKLTSELGESEREYLQRARALTLALKKYKDRLGELNRKND